MATKDEGRLIYTTDDMSINLYQVRVPLIAQSWDPGSEEVETHGGNGRKWERGRGRNFKSAAFVCKMI